MWFVCFGLVCSRFLYMGGLHIIVYLLWCSFAMVAICLGGGGVAGAVCICSVFDWGIYDVFALLRIYGACMLHFFMFLLVVRRVWFVCVCSGCCV